VYIRKQEKPLITGASFHYKVRLPSLCTPPHKTTVHSVFPNVRTASGCSIVSEPFPCDSDEWHVGYSTTLHQLQRL